MQANTLIYPANEICDPIYKDLVEFGANFYYHHRYQEFYHLSQSEDHPMDDNPSKELVGLTAEIVSAYVSNNPVVANDLPGLIGDVHLALSRASSGAPPVEPTTQEDLRPAVPVKKSVTDEYIICLEDGKKFKSLKRHLRTRYKMSPDQYRAKWSLPPNYPMVAPNYAAARSQLAKKMGLGTRRDK